METAALVVGCIESTKTCYKSTNAEIPWAPDGNFITIVFRSSIVSDLDGSHQQNTDSEPDTL